MLFQQAHFGVKFNLLLFGQVVPPRLEFIGVFDLPCHLTTITHMEYNVDGMLLLFLFVSGKSISYGVVSGKSICMDRKGLPGRTAVP